MERTDLPFSHVLEHEIQEWKKFRRALRKEDQQFLDQLFEKAMLHVEAGVSVSKPWPFETILIYESQDLTIQTLSRQWNFLKGQVELGWGVRIRTFQLSNVHM